MGFDGELKGVFGLIWMGFAFFHWRFMDLREAFGLV